MTYAKRLIPGGPLTLHLKLSLQAATLFLRDGLLRAKNRRSTAAPEGVLPSVVLAGAPRCGTTSLARWLHENNIAFTGPSKEVHFFDRHYAFGVDWYRRQFTQQPGLDATPGYLNRHDVHLRLAETLPTAKCLVILREPAERSWSHYNYQRSRHYEWRSFEQALRDERAGFPLATQRLSRAAMEHFSYVKRSTYGRPLQHLRNTLADGHLLVLDFHQLFDGNENERRRLLSFLEVSNDRQLSPLPKMNASRPTSEFATIPDWVLEQWRRDLPALSEAAQTRLSWTI